MHYPTAADAVRSSSKSQSAHFIFTQVQESSKYSCFRSWDQYINMTQKPINWLANWLLQLRGSMTTHYIMYEEKKTKIGLSAVLLLVTSTQHRFCSEWILQSSQRQIVSIDPNQPLTLDTHTFTEHTHIHTLSHSNTHALHLISSPLHSPLHSSSSKLAECVYVCVCV